MRSYREAFLSASREISYDYEYLCKPRSSLRSLEAACPIVFSIGESVPELNRFKYSLPLSFESGRIDGAIPAANSQDCGKFLLILSVQFFRRYTI